MPPRKSPPIPVVRVKKRDSITTLYAKARRAFSAADLQRYTEIEAGIPAKQILAQLEALDQEDDRQRSTKAKHGRSR